MLKRVLSVGKFNTCVEKMFNWFKKKEELYPFKVQTINYIYYPHILKRMVEEIKKEPYVIFGKIYNDDCIESKDIIGIVKKVELKDGVIEGEMVFTGDNTVRIDTVKRMIPFLGTIVLKAKLIATVKKKVVGDDMKFVNLFVDR